MHRDDIYFGNEGATRSSAQRMCDKAKDIYTIAEKKRNGIQFYDELLCNIGNASTQVVLKYGSDVMDYTDELYKEIAYKNFISYFKEAIKALDRKFALLKSYSFKQWAKDNDIEVPIEPEIGETLNEDKWLQSQTLEARIAYTNALNKAAVFGAFIHPNGVFNKAKEKLIDALNNPIVVDGHGRDANLTERKPKAILDDVEEVALRIRKIADDAQAALNALKGQRDKAIQESELKVNREYNIKWEEYRVKMGELRAQYNEHFKREEAEIGKLKIRIPEKFKPIWDQLSQKK